MEALTLITGNKRKAEEFSRLIGTTVVCKSFQLPEIQDTDVVVVAKAKAEMAYKEIGQPVFVDDTGLYINAWGNLPGALIAWFLDNVGNEGILRMLKAWDDRSARVVTALGYCDKRGAKVFVGTVNGMISDLPKGENGFGYDAIFIPEKQDKTFAEMSSTEKDANSMRAHAAEAMRNYLNRD